MSPEQKRVTIKEFALKKGIAVATLCGVMSACFAYALAAGEPIKALTLKQGTPALWQGLPVLVIVLIGGFITNFVWCAVLNIRNRTGYQYFSSTSRNPSPGSEREITIETATDAPAREVAEHTACALGERKPPASPYACELFAMRARRNHMVFPVLLGPWGKLRWGRYKFSSWTLHMASIIIFGSLWGIGLKEWEGRRSSGREVALPGTGSVGRINLHCGLRKLSRTSLIFLCRGRPEKIC